MSKYDVILYRHEEGAAIMLVFGTEPRKTDDGGLMWQSDKVLNGLYRLPRETFPELRGGEFWETTLCIKKPNFFQRLYKRLFKNTNTKRHETAQLPTPRR